MSSETKKLAEEMSKDRKIQELERQLEEANAKAKEEIKNDDDQNSEQANADEPEKVKGEVEDQPKDLPAVKKKGLKGKFNDWKVEHPRASKWIARAGVGAAVVGAWMLGKSQQEKKDAQTIQAAIENGEIVRVNQEEDAETNNEEFEE